MSEFIENALFCRYVSDFQMISKLVYHTCFYITVISRLHYGFHFDGVLCDPADCLPTFRPHQRRDSGVCGRGLELNIIFYVTSIAFCHHLYTFA